MSTIPQNMISSRPAELGYAIVLCEELQKMRAFYERAFGMPIAKDTPTSVAFLAGAVHLGLRLRTRSYDGVGQVRHPPCVQLAFLVPQAEVDQCYQRLVAERIPVLDPPRDQPWGHRTLFFEDPEGNILEFYAELHS